MLLVKPTRSGQLESVTSSHLRRLPWPHAEQAVTCVHLLLTYLYSCRNKSLQQTSMIILVPGARNYVTIMWWVHASVIAVSVLPTGNTCMERCRGHRVSTTTLLGHIDAADRCSTIHLITGPGPLITKLQQKCKDTYAVFVCVCVCVHVPAGAAHLQPGCMAAGTHSFPSMSRTPTASEGSFIGSGISLTTNLDISGPACRTPPSWALHRASARRRLRGV